MAYSNGGDKPFTSERIEGTGNLVGDPKIISNPGKTPVAVMRVAANSRAIDRNGDVVEGVEFRDLKVFGWKAETITENARQGSLVSYTGRLSPTSYTPKGSDEPVISFEVLIDNIGILPRTEGGGGSRSRRDDDDDDAPRSRSRSRSRRDDDDEDDAPRSRSRSRSRNDDDDIDPDDLDEETPKRSSRRSGRAKVEDSADEYVSDDLI